MGKTNTRETPGGRAICTCSFSAWLVLQSHNRCDAGVRRPHVDPDGSEVLHTPPEDPPRGSKMLPAEQRGRAGAEGERADWWVAGRGRLGGGITTKQKLKAFPGYSVRLSFWMVHLASLTAAEQNKAENSEQNRAEQIKTSRIKVNSTAQEQIRAKKSRTDHCRET